MAKKKQSAESARLEALREERRKLDKKIYKETQAENERAGLAGFRDRVTEVAKDHNERVDRQNGYDTLDKARTFGFGSFTSSADGSLRFVRLDSVYAMTVETPDKDATSTKAFTFLKTVDGPVDVAESADEVMNEFNRVRFAGSRERVLEMQAELARIEDRVAERKAKRAEKNAEKGAETPKGPDFQTVSDLVGTADDEDVIDLADPEIEDDDRDFATPGAEIDGELPGMDEDDDDPAADSDFGIVNDEDKS